jgi:hypothetical protein
VESDAYAVYVDKKPSIPPVPRPTLSLPGPATPPPIPIGFPTPRATPRATPQATPGVGPVIGAAAQGAAPPPPAAAPGSVGDAGPRVPQQGADRRQIDGEGGDLTPPPGPLPAPPVVVVGAKTPPLGTIISHKRS